MKHTFLFLIVMSLCIAFTGCNAPKKPGPPEGGAFDKDTSYALGMRLADNFFMPDNIRPDLEELVQGMKDVIDGSRTRYSMDLADQIVQEAFSAIMEKREEVGKKAENEFLAENSRKSGITITGSGLQYEVITRGNGPQPTIDDTVQVHYEGTLIDGTVFDSSYSRGEPVEFPLYGVIPGWTEALQLMNVGSKYRLFIPSDLGYGPRGAGAQIPPYSTLIFEVELLDIIQTQ